MKIVVNKCFGGFGLSDAAYRRLVELGIPVRRCFKEQRGPDERYKPEPRNDGEIIFDRRLTPVEELRDHEKDRESYERVMGRYWDTWTRENRTHPLVVQVVEELGAKASSSLAKLAIVEVPDGVDWELDEYDGIETVREKSRTFG